MLGDRQPGRRRHLPDLRLGQLAEREPHPRERLRRERGEHVRLILGGVGGDPQQRTGGVIAFGDPRVVARGQVVAAEAAGELQHRVEAHVAVAADTRVRSLARGVTTR